MVAVISAGRKDQGSSFKALQTYLTLEVDPVTQERVLRGDVESIKIRVIRQPFGTWAPRGLA